ncbi:alpha-SNAP [Fowlpox virus]|uniref:Alpha-SNAP n=1 Tax=Fowlpox virus TaxID=10261 RepID=Q70HD9_FOWPV|nr:putative soluble NSF attachment protein-like protein [Fowlpox virus]CAE52557.1 putative soluble NSF attachment protein homolog [Fowlpox virus isolate HP-438/Munich]QRM13543.1 alpha-SNAP [Fowlpox virus]UHJ15009.1 alpha-SNAP [Fowlpox virus]UHJ15266.1 alpha-SNAP [Fowlpox virus]
MDRKEVEQKATKILEDAENKIKGKSFFKNLFGPPIEIEEAAGMVSHAANLFASVQLWECAGKAFFKSGDMLLQKNKNSIAAASSFVDAANAFKKIDSYEAINCLSKAIEVYTCLGKFYTVARCHMNIAAIYENDILELDKAIFHYENASGYYGGEGYNKLSDDCMLLIARLSIQKEDFDRAGKIFEQVGYNRMNTMLSKYESRHQLLYAIMCYLCSDVSRAKRSLDKYKDIFPAFKDFKECKFIEKILAACETKNIETFTSAIEEYDHGNTIDEALMSMLLTIRKATFEDEVE